MISQQEWDAELIRLDAFFKSVTLPGELQISKAYYAHNVQQYVNTNIDLAKAGPSTWNVGPMLRLQELEKVLLTVSPAS